MPRLGSHLAWNTPMPAPHLRQPLLATLLLALCACGSMAPPASRAQDPAAPATKGTVDAPAGATAASTGPARDDRAAQTLSLRPGEQVALDGGRLRYLRLVNDSRCAPDVQCIWAGDAEIAMAWTPAGGAPRNFSLHTGVEPRQQVLGDGRSLRLVELARGPSPNARLELGHGP